MFLILRKKGAQTKSVGIRVRQAITISLLILDNIIIYNDILSGSLESIALNVLDFTKDDKR